jgi:CRP-like cAMP-binding protein
LIFAVSYWLTNIFWLRVTAVIGLAFEIAYFRMAGGGGLHVGIGWDVVFILINLWQIYRLVAQRRALASLAEVDMLRQGPFAGLESGRLAQLLATGGWRDFAAGTRLTEEGEPVPHLILICRGRAAVEAGGKRIATLHGGAFVGEMAFLSGNPASATVMVEDPVHAFVFDLAKLSAMARTDEAIAGDVHRAVGRDLARKLAGA